MFQLSAQHLIRIFLALMRFSKSCSSYSIVRHRNLCWSLCKVSIVVFWLYPKLKPVVKFLHKAGRWNFMKIWSTLLQQRMSCCVSLNQYIKGDRVNRTILYVFKMENSCVGCITCNMLISISLVLTCARTYLKWTGDFSCHFIANIPRKL